MQKTRGIIIHSLKYGDNSLISRIYTEDFGLLSFIVHGARKKRSSKKHNIFQPLNIIEIVFNFKNTGNLQIIKELQLVSQHRNIPFDVIKTSIALFISEVLKGCLKEQEKNPSLFEFLFKSILLLDQVKQTHPAFHHVFMVELSSFLGFAPSNNLDDIKTKFDLKEGLYQPSSYYSQYCLTTEESVLFHKLQNTALTNLDSLIISSSGRKALLYKIIDFYRLHVVGFKELSSPKVLEEVLH